MIPQHIVVKLPITWYRKRCLKKRQKSLEIFWERIVLLYISSTSIPKLSVKPIMDIMPMVLDMQKVDEKNQTLRCLDMNMLENWVFSEEDICIKANRSVRLRFLFLSNPINRISKAYCSTIAYTPRGCSWI